MRKKITFLMALACMGALSVSGATPQKKVAEITSQKRIVADGGNKLYWEDSYCETFFYDKNGNETSYTRYRNSQKTSSYATIAKEYDGQGRLIKETEGTNVTTYTYGANGLLTGKVKANPWTTERASYKYDSNGRLLSEENTKDGSKYDKESSVIYSYDQNGNLTLKISYGNTSVYDSRLGKSVEGYVKKETVQYLYENNDLVTDTTKTYGYEINDAGDGLAEMSSFTKAYSHYIYNTDGTAKTDTLWLYDDFASTMLPTANVYTYDENGLLVKKEEKSTWVPPTGFEREFLDTYVYTYHYSQVGPDYVPTITGITAGEEFASIIIAYTPPAVTEGLEGYKLVVDGIVKDEVFPLNAENTISVAKQARGEHAYALLPIYKDMIPACFSDNFNYTININLNKAKNLRVASCSYKTGYEKWTIKVRWDAPDEGNGTLIGYRMTSTKGSQPDKEENQGKNIKTLYNQMRQQSEDVYTYYLYAVYEEGESDPIKITEDFKTDLNRVVVDYTCDNIAELKKACDGATDKTKEYTLNNLAVVNGVVRDADSKIYGIYISDNTGAIKLTGSVNALVDHNIKNVKGTMSKTEKGQYVFNCTALEDDGYARPAPVPNFTSFVPFYEISDYSLGVSQSKFYSFKNVTVEVKTDANGVKYGEVTQKDLEVDYIVDPEHPENAPTPVVKDVTMKLIDPSNKVFTAEKVYTPANITGAFLEIDAEGKPYWVLKDAKSFEAVVPAPTDLKLVAYQCKEQYGSYKWGGKAVWKAPEGAENFTFKNYKLTMAPVEGKGFASPNTVTTPYSSTWTYYAQKAEGETDIVTISVVAVYEEGTSEPCEIEFDFTDRTKVLRNYDMNDLYEMISSGIDPDNHEYNFVGEATIAGIVPNYAAYIADAKGVMKVNFPAEKLAGLSMGSVITNMKGVLKQTSLGQWYFEATEVEKTDKTATVEPAELNVNAYTSNQNKLVVVKNAKMTVEMDPLSRAYVGTLTQVLYPGTDYSETVTGKLYDPSNKILAKYSGKGELDVKSVIAFVDIDQEEAKKVSKFILRGAPDDLLIEGLEEYETLKSVKEASFDEDVTYTGKALVTGKVPNSASFIYFIQDETGAMNGMMKFGMQNLPAMGDTITNVVFMSYSKADGFMCKDFDVVSSGATVTPEDRTLAAIKANGDADNAKFVKISDAVVECKLDAEGSFFQVFNLIQETDTMAIDYKGDVIDELVAMNGATVEMKCYVLGTALRLSEVSDIKVTKEPIAVRANLKEVKEGDNKNCIISGKVLVIGKVVNLASYIYFLQDGTANIVMMGNKADAVINKGDSIVNLEGSYDGKLFLYSKGAEIVSKNNEVKAEEKTLADFDPEADDAHYLFIRNAVLNFKLDETGKLFKVKPTLTQDGKTVNMDYYGEDYAAMKNLNGKPVDVNCYVFDGKLYLSDPVSTEMVENKEAISTIGADRLYVVDGNVIAEGAVGVTVYDTTGRVLAASETNQVSVAGLSGTLVVKVSYANGDVKVSKLMVR